MIPMLILYLFKKLKETNLSAKIGVYVKKSVLRLIVLLILLLVTNVGASDTIPARKSIVYKVLKKNKIIGNIHVNRNTINDSTKYELSSKINASYIVNFNIESKEQAVYFNSMLVSSKVFRKLNNKIRTNHQLVFEKGGYTFINHKEITQQHINPITQNLIKLYFEEPRGVAEVYCDNLNKIVKVKAIGKGVYQVVFSKGKFNIFHYKNGKCVKIIAVNSLFKVTLIPN